MSGIHIDKTVFLWYQISQRASSWAYHWIIRDKFTQILSTWGTKDEDSGGSFGSLGSDSILDQSRHFFEEFIFGVLTVDLEEIVLVDFFDMIDIQVIFESVVAGSFILILNVNPFIFAVLDLLPLKNNQQHWQGILNCTRRPFRFLDQEDWEPRKCRG